MIRTILILIFILSLTATVSCTVISRQVRSEAESPVPFKKLIEDADQYSGRMVILGGYILETKNLASETILKVLQVPFRVGEEPDSRDLSQGRFVVYYKGFRPGGLRQGSSHNGGRQGNGICGRKNWR